ncbi:MAG: PKD domain-containing protein, partial [Bacteroidetes bacterium]
TDDCGNVSTATQVIQTTDAVPPQLTGIPDDITVECDSIPQTPTVTATDNCDAEVEILFEEEVFPQQCDQTYALKRTWTAMDDCGNTTTAVQWVIVQDRGAPVIEGVPADEQASCGAIPPVPPDGTVTAFDNCDPAPTLSFQEIVEGDSCNLTIRRIWTAVDACGNETIEEQLISVSDEAPPVLSAVPDDITVECDAVPDPDTPVATDDCDAEVEIFLSETITPGDCPESYTLIRTWTATDDCGNQALGMQRIVVLDGEAPVISGVPADTVVSCGAVPPPAASVSAFDACAGSVQVVFEESTQPLPCGEAIVRTWTATDGCGNSATATQTITVQDQEAPQFEQLPQDIAVGCESIPDAPVLTAVDDCDEEVEVLLSEVITPGDCPGNFTITRTWTATDDCGNETTAVQVVSVSDTEAPGLVGIPADTLINLGQGQSVPPPPVIGVDILAQDSCDQDPVITFDETQTPTADGFLITRTWTVTDACGNSRSVQQIITVISTIEVEINLEKPEICDGTTAQLSAQPDDPSYQYLWTASGGTLTPDDQPHTTFTPAGPGQYSVSLTVTTPSGASGMDSTLITVLEVHQVSAQVLSQPLCEGPNGSVLLEVSGGSGSFNYLWSDGVVGSEPQRDDLSNGSYSVTVVDQLSGCTAEAAFELQGPPVGAASIGSEGGTASCPGAADAFVDLIIELGTDFVEPASVVIVDANGTVFQNGSLPAGSYCAELYDGNGCLAATGCFLVLDPQALSVTPTLTHQTCMENGSISLEISGGTPFSSGNPYRVDWADLPGTDDPAERLDLEAGFYSVTVSDTNGCTAVLDSLEIRDECGPCVEPVVSEVQVTDAHCGQPDGSIVLVVEGDPADFTYQWSPAVSNTHQASNLSASVYHVTIERADHPGCLTELTVVVNSEGGPEVEVQIQPDFCASGTGGATLHPPTLMYLWTHDQFVGNERFDLPAGTYHVIAMEPSNPMCPTVLTLTVPGEEGLGVSIAVVEEPSCGEANGALQVEVLGASGAPFFDWSDVPGTNQSTRDNLAAGTYSVTVTDPQSGCSGSATVELEGLPFAPAAVSAQNTQVSCFGAADASADYEVTPGSGFAGPPTVLILDGQGQPAQDGQLAPGEYCVQVTDANGCFAGEACFEVLEPEPLEVDAAVLPQDCEQGGSIQLTATGGTPPLSYDWNDLPGTDDPQNRTDLSAGSYSVTVTDGNGCTAVL